MGARKLSVRHLRKICYFALETYLFSLIRHLNDFLSLLIHIFRRFLLFLLACLHLCSWRLTKISIIKHCLLRQTLMSMFIIFLWQSLCQSVRYLLLQRRPWIFAFDLIFSNLLTILTVIFILNLRCESLFRRVLRSVDNC